LVSYEVICTVLLMCSRICGPCDMSMAAGGVRVRVLCHYCAELPSTSQRFSSTMEKIVVLVVARGGRCNPHFVCVAGRRRGSDDTYVYEGAV